MNTVKEMSLAEILSNAEEYVKLRKKAGGGFAATPRLPATVEDTYHGLRIISSISPLIRKGLFQDIRRWPELSSFLAGFISRDLDLGPRGAFQLFWCMKQCAVLPEKEQVTAMVNRQVLRSLKRENLYFALRIYMECLDVGNKSGFALLLQKAETGALFTGILRRRMMDLYLDRNLNWNRVVPQEAAGWFSACQNPDGGFGFMPGTTSYIENCHYGLAALNMLNAKPVDSGACWNFIMGCRTKSGGFSRNSNAAPFLDATWHAVKSLLLLREFMKNRCTCSHAGASKALSDT